MNQIAPLMIDLAGPELRPEERQRLGDPRVGGVILFSRNYTGRGQLSALVAAVRACRLAPLLIATDHEGGRVQRFRDGFSALPAMATLGHYYLAAPALALQAAEDVGFVLAHELLACGLDFSFTPVLDLDFGRSAVIGDRAFSADPTTVVALAGALVRGLEAAGSAGVGKHFPGHGHVAADSHTDLPVDLRDRAELEGADLLPFRALAAGLRGMMPAHVVYASCDPHPAGFSRFWLRDMLRTQIGFAGAIFSDDLAMAGALGAGRPAQRAAAAFAAGCDMALLCNDPAAVDTLLAEIGAVVAPTGAGERLARLRARPSGRAALARYTDACRRLDHCGLDGWSAA
jgi:beta-N-acetylhexosaminidase